MMVPLTTRCKFIAPLQLTQHGVLTVGKAIIFYIGDTGSQITAGQHGPPRW